MTTRTVLFGACALLMELTTGLRAMSKETGNASAAANASVLQAEGGYNCYDTDGGAVNKKGYGCDMYEMRDCLFAEYNTATFNAGTMCCKCGGGSSRASDGSCPSTCYGYTCDEWVNSGYTCTSLQEEYSCNCQGCQLCEEIAPTFTRLGAGLCVAEDGSELAPFKNLMWTGRTRCGNLCEEMTECTGYSVSDFFCHLHVHTGFKASGVFDDGAECWAKTALVPEGGKKTTKAGVVKKPAAHEGQAELVASPPEDDDVDETENVVENAESDKEERRVANQSPKVVPVIGLKNENFAQTFKFLKGFGGRGASVFHLDSSFYPMGACEDDSKDKCWTDTRVPGSCQERPELRQRCKKACGLCGSRNSININIMYLVSADDKSHLDAQRIVFANEQGALVTYSMHRPQLVASHDTWRVKDSAGEVLFTIQKRKRDVDCKHLFFDCKAVWKIYQGRKKDGLLRFYGIQHEHAFKFYPSREDFEKDKVNWLASFKKTLPTAENNHSSFQVTVMPGQDVGLMLLAAYAVNNAGDMVKLKKQKK